MPAGGPAEGPGGAEGRTKFRSESPQSAADHPAGGPRRSESSSKDLNRKNRTETEACLLNVCVCVWGAGKRGLDERLTTTQILLQQQEEGVRRGDRERRALSDRVKSLERCLQTSESEKKHAQVRSVCSHSQQGPDGSVISFIWRGL